MGVTSDARFGFGPFQLDWRAKELQRNGIRVRIPEQSLQVLVMLLEHPGEVVTRQELHHTLWPNGTIVEFDQSINAAVRRLRQALDDSTEAPRYIETLPRVGYRFIGSVERVPLAETGGPPNSIQQKSTDLEGQVISHYRILNKLGAGGLGVVYKAEDTRLGRTVALKFLPDLFADDPSAADRFQREARAASALNHPNICTVYDMVRASGRSFLVMEYLGGQSLGQRVTGKPLPLAEILDVSRQIADALDSAHQVGIVHRDLKPDNIVLTKSGAKLVDFGLATMRRTEFAAEESAAMNAALREGAAVCAFQYLAPEQLQGKEEDGRTDIFALGAVMYEMITGRPPFEGSSQSTVRSAILGHDPPPTTALEPLTPAALDHVVRTCLAKDPKERWQVARDIVHELKWITESISSLGVSSPVVQHRSRRELLSWALTGVSAAGLGAAAIVSRRGVVETQPVRFIVGMPDNVVLDWWDYPAMAPNGRQFVIPGRVAGKRMLWIRAIDSLAVEPIPASDGAYYPFWSPDSRFVAFFTVPGKLKKIEINGGAAETLCNVPSGGGANGGTWNRKGMILFAVYGAAIRGMSENGGESREVLDLDRSRQELSQAWPQFLPNGRDFLYLGLSTDMEKNNIRIGSLESKRTRLLIQGNSNASYAEPGFLLYGREGKLLAQPFDAEKLRVAAAPQPILQQVGEMPGFAATLYSSSQNGVLVYRTGGAVRVQLAWYDRTGRKLGTIGAPELYERITLSPDEKRVATSRIEPPTRTSSIWVIELSTGIASRVTFGNDNTPAWSPDSRELVFASLRNGRPSVYRKTLGSGNETELYESEEGPSPLQWTSDEKLLLVTMPSGTRTFSELPVTAPRKPVTLLKSEFEIDDPMLSPDGTCIAYDSQESGRWETYVAAFPSFNHKHQISDSGGVQPVWRKDGKELFYLNRDGRLMVVNVTVRSNIETGPPQPLFQTTIDAHSGAGQFCATRDGKRFLLAEPADRTRDAIVVVTNWNSGLNR